MVTPTDANELPNPQDSDLSDEIQPIFSKDSHPHQVER